MEDSLDKSQMRDHREFAWYGKAFYFVELPRRFMVSLWGIPVYWLILPEQWMGLLAAACCLGFDLLVTRRAPDIRITKDEVQAKLASGEAPVFLTWKETLIRLGWVTVGGALLAAIATYWFTHGQQPVLLSRFLYTTVIAIAIAYVSALGVPLRTKRDLREGDRPFLFPLFPKLTRLQLSCFYGWPVFHWPAVLLLWVYAYSMGPAKSTGGGPGYTGELDALLCYMLFCYGLFLTCIMTMPLAILERKIAWSKSRVNFLNKQQQSCLA